MTAKLVREQNSALALVRRPNYPKTLSIEGETFALNQVLGSLIVLGCHNHRLDLGV
jgi:hypothetical protein